jgi:hypothetical protein
MREYRFEVYIIKGKSWTMRVFAADEAAAKTKVMDLVPGCTVEKLKK